MGVFKKLNTFRGAVCFRPIPYCCFNRTNDGVFYTKSGAGLGETWLFKVYNFGKAKFLKFNQREYTSELHNCFYRNKNCRRKDKSESQYLLSFRDEALK